LSNVHDIGPEHFLSRLIEGKEALALRAKSGKITTGYGMLSLRFLHRLFYIILSIACRLHLLRHGKGFLGSRIGGTPGVFDGPDEARWHFRTPFADSGRATLLASFQVQFQKLCRNFLIAHAGLPAVGGEDGFVQLPVGQV
jgi:hypothetical protein